MTPINQIFSSSRFALYLKKYWAENMSKIILSYAVLLAMALLYTVGLPWLKDTYLTPSHIDPMITNETLFFGIMFVIAASAFGTMFYSQLTTKHQRIALFTNPASQLEKFCTFFLIYVIGFIIVYIAAVFISDAVRVWIYSNYSDAEATIRYLSFKEFFSLGFSNDYDFINANQEYERFKTFAISMQWIGVFSMLATFSLGCCVWPKNAFLKTFAFISVFQGAFTFMMILGMKCFKKDVVTIGSYADSWYYIWGLQTISVVIIIFMFWLGYARFKEWEVIKRW